MDGAKSKVNAAEKATEAINELVKQAALILREGYDGRIMSTPMACC
jgi:hypothetical protein